LAFGALAPTLETLRAQPPAPQGSNPEVSAREEAEPTNFILELVEHLNPFNFDGAKLMNLLKRPGYTVAAFVALTIIVFVETGLLIGFFLPGDSLLVVAGLTCAGAQWNLPLLLVLLCLAAVVGDSVGYTIGFKTGPRLFNREKSWLFKKDHLLKAQEFYERHGGKTIILARFMPIIRTFAPVVAGAGKMNYRRFLAFNVIGGVGWVVSMVLIGYCLGDALKYIFGESFDVVKHIEKVVILVVLVSISPGIYVWLRSKFRGKTAAPAEIPEKEPVRAAE